MTTVYFATNRNAKTSGGEITGFGKQLSQSGLDDLRFGIAKVKSKSIELKVLPDDPKKGSQALFKKIKGQMDTGCDTIVFIHGYNNSFEDAIRDGAEMQKKYAIHNNQNSFKPNIFVFTWPSDGQNFPPSVYSSDRRDAKASAPAFARGLLKLGDFINALDPDKLCEGKLHLIAHSMGVYLLRWALQEMRGLTGDDLRRLFEQIILTAADEDDDAFELDHKLAPLPMICQRITVYFNNHDLALVVSDKTKNNPDRLGHDGPRKPHKIPAKVVLVDVTDLHTVTDSKGHSYHLENNRVVKDIRAVFLGVASEKIKGRVYVPHANKFRLKS